MLDVAGHLSSFGWKGHGTALREGAITRPLLVSQKKSLSGLGKDRDEAYPFWDHVFAAAAKTITIKIAGSDDEQSSDDEASTSKQAGTGTIARTKTGIISNRRPTSTCTTPGDATPDLVSDATTASSSSQLSIMSQAKREAAKRALYARFYRGPVIKSEVDAELDEPAKKKRKRSGEDDSDSDSDSSDDDGNVGTHWRTLAAAVTAPVADDKAARKAARAERKAARAERRALRAAKREAKRAKEERKGKKRKADEVAPATAASGDVSKKEKKKRRNSSAADDAASEVEKPKKKKKRKTGD